MMRHFFLQMLTCVHQIHVDLLEHVLTFSNHMYALVMMFMLERTVSIGKEVVILKQRNHHHVIMITLVTEKVIFSPTERSYYFSYSKQLCRSNIIIGDPNCRKSGFDLSTKLKTR